MSLINTISITDTFRSWIARTNNVIDLMNSNTMVVGGEAIGAFTLGNTTHTGSSLTVNGNTSVGKLLANMSGLFLSANVSIGANTTVNASAYSFTVSANVTLLQSPNGTFVNNSTLTVNAPAVFQGTTSVSNTFAVTRTATFQANVSVANNLIASNTIYARAMLFSETGAVVTDTISSATYHDYTVAGIADAAVLHLNPNVSDVSITGIDSPSNLAAGARVLYIQNISSSYKIVLKSENGSSLVGNRIKIPLDADLEIPAGGSLPLIYAVNTARWRPLAAAGGGSSNAGSFTTLSTSGLATFSGNAVFDTDVLFIDATNNRVGIGTATPTSPLHVVGNSFFANTTISGWANLTSTLLVASAATFNSTLALNGSATFANTLLVTGAVTLSNTIGITGNASIGNSTSNVVFSAAGPTVANTSTSAAKDWYGITPAGAILMFGGSTAPTGWLLANGQAVSRSTYATLFGVISTTYGVGDGSTTFNVPDLRQKFPLGKADSGTGVTLGSTGGTIDHTHTGPSHTHTGPSHTHSISTDGAHTHTVGSGLRDIQSGSGQSVIDSVDAATGSSGSHSHTGATGASGTAATGAAGTGATGTANPPYVVVNYIIKS